MALGWGFALNRKAMTAGNPLPGHFSWQTRGRYYSGVGSAPVNRFVIPNWKSEFGVLRSCIAVPLHGVARRRGDFDFEEQS